MDTKGFFQFEIIINVQQNLQIVKIEQYEEDLVNSAVCELSIIAANSDWSRYLYIYTCI